MARNEARLDAEFLVRVRERSESGTCVARFGAGPARAGVGGIVAGSSVVELPKVCKSQRSREAKGPWVGGGEIGG